MFVADLAAVAKVTQACGKSAARAHISHPAASLRRHARLGLYQIADDVGCLDEGAGAGSLMIGAHLTPSLFAARR